MSDAYVIDGPCPLQGEVDVAGAKNSALYLLAAALLAPGRTTLTRVPRIGDVESMVQVLEALGVQVEWTGGSEIVMDVPETLRPEAPYQIVNRMRASIAVLGPLVARERTAKVAMPGGCNLGQRGIDLHLRGLEQLGARVGVSHGYLEAAASQLVGARIQLDYPSHGATANLMMAAVLATGETVIDCASQEPEVVELATFLNRMGACVDGAGTSTIRIQGRTRLHPTSMRVMPDRLEAGTYMFASAATGGDVLIRDIRPEHLRIVIEKLRETGADVDTGPSWIRVRGSSERPAPTDVSTLPYPGFPTDLQPLAVGLLCMADGLSIVTENIFDARFMFVDELVRMGANVRVDGHYAVIRGVSELSAAPVAAPDIRAGAALVIAGLCARGRTVVEDVHLIERGYEDLPRSLAGLGASIHRVPSTASLSA